LEASNRGSNMAAVAAIAIFLVVIVLLNWIEFGRPD
jgi:hypothetical protein